MIIVDFVEYLEYMNENEFFYEKSFWFCVLTGDYETIFSILPPFISSDDLSFVSFDTSSSLIMANVTYNYYNYYVGFTTNTLLLPFSFYYSENCCDNLDFTSILGKL